LAFLVVALVFGAMVELEVSRTDGSISFGGFAADRASSVTFELLYKLKRARLVLSSAALAHVIVIIFNSPLSKRLISETL